MDAKSRIILTLPKNMATQVQRGKKKTFADFVLHL